MASARPQCPEGRTYPGKGDAGGVHGGGGGHGSFVAQQHQEAGQAVEEGGEGRGWLLNKEEPGEGPLRGDGGGASVGWREHREPQPPSPPLCAHLAMELRHAAAALHIEPHCVPHALILAVIVARPAWGWGAGGPGVGLSVSLLPAPPPVPLSTVGVRTPICHGQGEGSRMALSLPSAAQYPPSWLCASQHSPACSNVAQCSPRTDQQPSNLTPAWPSASRSIPALPVRSQSGTSDPPQSGLTSAQCSPVQN